MTKSRKRQRRDARKLNTSHKRYVTHVPDSARPRQSTVGTAVHEAIVSHAKPANKYLYLYVVQGYYADSYGYEDLYEGEYAKDAQYVLNEYDTNEPQYAHRTIKRRVPNPAYHNPTHI